MSVEAALFHWAILSLHQELTETGYKIVAHTNHPCHLYMRWTIENPWVHIITKDERGAPLGKDIRTCFVAYHTNEQLEPGDTLEHTFIKEPWASCETRWFYFYATVEEMFSPSESPVFMKHRPTEGFFLVLLEPWTVTAEPPEFELVLSEPWTAVTTPPDFTLVFKEEWTS